MVLYDPQAFGGLEEHAVALAIGLKQRSHSVSVLSATWVPSDNQYVRRLREHHVTYAQPPKWLSYPGSHWPTKERILAKALWLLSPLTLLLGSGLFLLRRRPWGAAQRSARNFLRGLVLSRLIGPDRRPALGRLLLNWWGLRWHPDLLHVHGYATTLLFAIEWAHSRRLPVVYEEHQTPDSQFDWWRGFRESINKATVVVAVSEQSAQALRSLCGVTQPSVVMHRFVADPAASGWLRDARWQPRGDQVSVTTVARLYVTKGLSFLLEAIAQVKATHPTAQFRVYGDGPLRPELLRQAEELGLDGNGIFVGPFTDRQELSRIMAQTDIFVMSSILEGQPLGLVEAMAYGCPVVATAVGGIPELIQDGVNGLLCAPKDAACLASKIRTLIDDPELRARLGRAARQSYEQGPFQPALAFDQFVSVYAGALGLAHSRQPPAGSPAVPGGEHVQTS